MNFYIYTLGCKVNAYESELMKELLLKDGFVYNENDPQIIIVNTCSVTNVADNKSLKMVRHFHKNYPNALLAVCGCSAQNKASEYQKLGIDILIGNQQKSQIVSLIKKYLENKETYFYINNNRQLPFENMQINRFATHTRAYVKIEDGCDNFCSYCVIPYVRGACRSKDFSLALEEIKTLVSNNHQEIVLTGIHTGSYHSKEGKDLSDLLHEMGKIEGLKRIRISSIEVTELNDKFLKELKNNLKICNHLHIPLQAGSDEILKKMNRKYNLDEFKQKIAQIRAIRPDIAITTDIIVGHPYETEELFEQTLLTAQELNFAKIHVFPYSPRQKTVAATMPMQVSEEQKKSRSKRLITLSNALESKYYHQFLNQKLDVLIETIKDNVSYGKTDNYLKVKILENLKPNTFVNITITNYEDGYLIGVVTEKSLI